MKLARHLLVVGSVVLSACGRPAATGGTTPPPVASPAAIADASAAANAFASELHPRLAKEGGNLFYSPASIALAVGMAREGARGVTASEMDAVLHLAGKPPGTMGAIAALAQPTGAGAPEVRIANRLWVDGSLSLDAAYLALTRTSYGASAVGVDFRGAPERSRTAINDWVEDETRDKIKELLPSGSINDQTKLVITNAIYFKGTWKTVFAAKDTAPAPFYVSGKDARSVPLMHQSVDVTHGAIGGAHVFSLLYARAADDKGMSMVVILPDSRDGLPAVESAIAKSGFDAFLGALGASAHAEVWLPKLKLTASFELTRVLQAMGIHAAFTDDADFSGITARGGLEISQVIHKAFVEVDEQGTEAAAATAVLMMPTGAAMDPPSFRVDHPFVFLIRDESSGAILFVGRVNDPA